MLPTPSNQQLSPSMLLAKSQAMRALSRSLGPVCVLASELGKVEHQNGIPHPIDDFELFRHELQCLPELQGKSLPDNVVTWYWSTVPVQTTMMWHTFNQLIRIAREQYLTRPWQGSHALWEYLSSDGQPALSLVDHRMPHHDSLLPEQLLPEGKLILAVDSAIPVEFSGTEQETVEDPEAGVGLEILNSSLPREPAGPSSSSAAVDDDSTDEADEDTTTWFAGLNADPADFADTMTDSSGDHTEFVSPPGEPCIPYFTYCDAIPVIIGPATDYAQPGVPVHDCTIGAPEQYSMPDDSQANTTSTSSPTPVARQVGRYAPNAEYDAEANSFNWSSDSTEDSQV